MVLEAFGISHSKNLDYIILNNTIPYYTILYYTALHYTTIYYTILFIYYENRTIIFIIIIIFFFIALGSKDPEG